jgi:hypothetical protein
MTSITDGFDVKRGESERSMSAKKPQSDERDGLSGPGGPETRPLDRTEAEAFRSACRHYARRAVHLRG